MQDTPFTPEELETYRRLAKATMAEMAQHMRISTRTYEELASGRATLRPLHRRVVERALLSIAWKRDDISILPDHLKELVRNLHGLIEAQERPK